MCCTCFNTPVVYFFYSKQHALHPTKSQEVVCLTNQRTRLYLQATNKDHFILQIDFVSACLNEILDTAIGCQGKQATDIIKLYGFPKLDFKNIVDFILQSLSYSSSLYIQTWKNGNNVFSAWQKLDQANAVSYNKRLKLIKFDAKGLTEDLTALG